MEINNKDKRIELETRGRTYSRFETKEFAERILRRSFVANGWSLVALPSVWARTRDTDCRVVWVEGTSDLIRSIGCEFNGQ